MSDKPASLRDTHWAVQLLAAAGLLAIAGFIVIVLFIVGIGRSEYQPRKVQGNDREVTFTVGNPEDLPGTDLIKLDVAVSDADGSYSASSGRDSRNFLLIDRKTGDSRKLLPDNGRRIADAHFLPAKAEMRGNDDALARPSEPKAPAEPVAYYLIETDDPSQPQREDVLVGRLSDRQQAYIMSGIDGIDTLWMLSPTQIGLIVRDHLKLYYRVIDVPSLKVVQSRPIAID
ncbi:MAG TPA: hypothetical protein VH331_05310 [Allosphingosinicella sp.]|nr:hypothetical protein [Allosphingosinicella sp.]